MSRPSTTPPPRRHPRPLAATSSARTAGLAATTDTAPSTSGVRMAVGGIGRRPPSPAPPPRCAAAGPARPPPRCRGVDRPRRKAGHATARYMAPVSRRSSPRCSARAWARVDLPAPAGPSMATDRAGHARSRPRRPGRPGRWRSPGSWWPTACPPEITVWPGPAARPGHGRGHGHAVVAFRVDGAGRRAGRPVHHEVVAVDLGVGAEGTQQCGHAGQAVGLLHPQLAHVAEHGVPCAEAAATASTGTSSRPVISAASISVACSGPTGDEVGGGPVAGPRRGHLVDVRPHAGEHVEEAPAPGPDVDALAPSRRCRARRRRPPPRRRPATGHRARRARTAASADGRTGRTTWPRRRRLHG